ncbi:MAG: sugar ABC transporter ATP-binding protein [Alteraurantiacibacter sp.]|nr:sugar ABC transporter ATP-binding protein [Alteraurantiacibacter sp.]
METRMQGEKSIMQLSGVRKTFPNGTVALRGVDLSVQPGKVHGLLGANGAGKSTLIKILSGAYPATAGEILWKGQRVRWDSPKAANSMGVATVHQHIPLVPTLTVLENVFLDDQGLWRQARSFRSRFAALCDRMGYRLDPDALVSELSIGQRQMVAIFQAMGTGADLIVLDEPTASLALDERELVYAAVRRISGVEGKAVLFVSHFLDEVMALTDQVTVLRDGVVVMTDATANLSESLIADAIVGKQVAALEHAPRRHGVKLAEGAVPRLSIRNLASPGKLHPLTLDVAPGEVVGLAGLLGSGRSEVLHAIYRDDRNATGDVLLDGKSFGKSTGAAVAAGIGLVPEDRNRQGLIPEFEIWRNISLPDLDGVSGLGGVLSAAEERARGWKAIRMLSIKASTPDILVTDLSGGNAQKVTIGRWFFSDVKLFLLDEPTAGIDIGAKAEILRLVRQLADQGKSVLIVSSEFEELLAVSDRILVMRDGRCIAEVAADQTNEHELLLLAGGQGGGAGQTPGNTHQTGIAP